MRMRGRHAACILTLAQMAQLDEVLHQCEEELREEFHLREADAREGLRRRACQQLSEAAQALGVAQAPDFRWADEPR